mmetsp:Transcript_12614/g.27997  ORF Transcript_12614/g.27997 Transcript_12614/m.27997 type:complete len:260 (-) Transcript_12614:2356-3135(-)
MQGVRPPRTDVSSHRARDYPPVMADTPRPRPRPRRQQQLQRHERHQQPQQRRRAGRIAARRVGEEVGAVLAPPGLVLSRVVVGRVHHVAVAGAGGAVAVAIGVAAVVQAQLLGTGCPEVPWNALAPADWVFYGAPAVEGAVISTVLGAAVISQEGGRAHGLPVPIADAVALPRVFLCAGDLVDVLHVGVQVRVGVACLARVGADLLVSCLVVVAEGAWAGGVGAVRAVVAHVALAEPVKAVAVAAAVVGAVEQVVVPHV